ncbi:MAG TPA: hypothetical protein VMF62_08775 [Acetobacteraceae bacterium]|jgi:hypothetical protein|nr:hypothetical protein [Acetobacteraceae bacterium]
MKTFLGVALTALVLLAPALSDAASVAQTAGQPQATSTDPAWTTYASGYGAQHPYAWLDYQDGIHLMPVSPVAHSGATGPAVRDSSAALMNRTGGER